jgi:D-alanine-D-alanine ligase
VHSVVRDNAALAQRVRFVLHEFRQPAMVEEFIDGREVSVAVLASTADQFVTLPISEILFDDLPSGVPKIVGYEAKWIANSPCDRGTVPCCPAELEATLAGRVRELALRAVRTLGIRDYGRVDFRLRERDGHPFVLEVNPNPDLSRDGGFIRAAKASGRTYASTLLEIVNLAGERVERR